ncbi:MAG: 50S ribosomal protein L32 [Ardenticatenaceae bacterium]|nr:50S ribosomal protein L32 [Anaerolineales bacterium]MCB8917299.1 50S ribosomal protein L32 [Ardenticatenaceae bacterium]
MGAVPKHRISKARRDRRRAHDALPPIHLVACDNCGEMKKPHYVCPLCGTYRGRQILPEPEE